MTALRPGWGFMLMGCFGCFALTAACQSDENGEGSGGSGNQSGSSGAGATGGSAGNTGTGGASGSGASGGASGSDGSGGASGSDGSGGANGTGGASGSSGSGGTAGADGSPGDTSPGCGLAGAATGAQNLEIVVGVARTYVLSVPEDYDPSTPYPLVFAWHGLGGSGSGARSYFRIERQANGGAIFVYPDGLPLANQGNEPGWDLAPDGVDVQLFDALVGDLLPKYCINPKRIFTTGHSYGGFFSNRLGCSRAAVLRGMAPVAGGPAFGRGGCSNPGPLAAWITNGINDDTVDFSSGEASRDLWTAANDCDATSQPTPPEPCVAFDGCERPVHWCAHEGGHEWPSFAAGAIWTFFEGLN